MNNRELHGGCSDQVSGTASGLPAGSDTTFRDAMMAYAGPKKRSVATAVSGRQKVQEKPID